MKCVNCTINFINENKDAKDGNMSDGALAHRADKIARDSNFDDVQRKDARFISGIMKTKAHLGFGVKTSNNHKSRNSRRRPGTKKNGNEEIADELHQPVKRKFQRRQVLVNEIDDVWAADLVEMQEWSKVNKGYRYILNVTDCFSKYAWIVPLKDKNGETVLEAVKYIVKISDRKPAYLWVDEGKEFYNKGLVESRENNTVFYTRRTQICYC